MAAMGVTGRRPAENLRAGTDPMNQAPAYGLWSLAVINAAVFILFALSFAKPTTTRDWRAFGAFSAFIVALFAEMYGFPLTIYLLSGWLQTRLPGVDLLSHDSGHLFEQLFGWRANPHFGPFHIVSARLDRGQVLFALPLVARVVCGTARGPACDLRTLLASAASAVCRVHPGPCRFLLQWPTLLTAVMFPILVVIYVRLARREKREAEDRFGDVYRNYAAVAPAFVPRLWHARQGAAQ